MSEAVIRHADCNDEMEAPYVIQSLTFQHCSKSIIVIRCLIINIASKKHVFLFGEDYLFPHLPSLCQRP